MGRLVSCSNRLVLLLSLVVGLAACSSEPRADVVVAAASDTRDAFEEVARVMSAEHGVTVEFVFGSSGMLREQVLNGAPYDVYVSANFAFVDEVIRAGAGEPDSRRAFATGRLALIAAPGVRLPGDLRAVADYGRIAIANPAHAPYGVAAKDALNSLGVYETLESRLILADNVADAVRIVAAGEADVGLVALSLVVDEPYVEVEPSLYRPIRQSLVVTKHGSDNADARKFVEVLESSVGRAILVRFGFTVEPQ